MKFGVCGSIDGMMDIAATAGADYLEPSVRDICAMSGDDFYDLENSVKKLPLPMPRANCLFPGDMALLKDYENNKENIRGYLLRAMYRCNSLGIKKVVFGSGAARMLPEDMSMAEGWRNLVKVTKLVGKIARMYGLGVVIEPLQRSETNFINSLGEGAILTAQANVKNVQLLADFYHMTCDGEPLTDIKRVGGVSHVHVAAKEGRAYPNEENMGDLPEFMGILRETGYDGLVSVEGNSTDPAKELKPALTLLRRLAGEEAEEKQ